MSDYSIFHTHRALFEFFEDKEMSVNEICIMTGGAPAYVRRQLKKFTDEKILKRRKISHYIEVEKHSKFGKELNLNVEIKENFYRINEDAQCLKSLRAL